MILSGQDRLSIRVGVADGDDGSTARALEIQTVMIMTFKYNKPHAKAERRQILMQSIANTSKSNARHSRRVADYMTGGDQQQKEAKRLVMVGSTTRRRFSCLLATSLVERLQHLLIRATVACGALDLVEVCLSNGQWGVPTVLRGGRH